MSAQVQIYGTPLLVLAKEIAEGFGAEFNVTPQSLYTYPIAHDNLVLKSDTWHNEYAQDGVSVVEHKAVRYIRTPSAQIIAKIRDAAREKNIQDAIQELLPELYADHSDSELAFFERMNPKNRTLYKSVLIRLERGSMKIEVEGKDSPNLESMVKISKNWQSKTITVNPYSAFESIKRYLLK
ncbi:hypothetical protein HYV80_00350 [Candidatus Woesearchaeota archaeon]|nr:hypothetical protein [Candidatus Woesearchaeota archaeon]